MVFTDLGPGMSILKVYIDKIGGYWVALSMYIFNMSYQHWPVVQGLESTPVDNIQIECVQQQKVPTVAAWQQCLKHLALLHGSGAWFTRSISKQQQ